MFQAALVTDQNSLAMLFCWVMPRSFFSAFAALTLCCSTALGQSASQLVSSLEKHTVVLRNYYTDTSLTFDGDGKLISGGTPGFGPTDGRFYVEHAEITDDRLVLVGERPALFWDLAAREFRLTDIGRRSEVFINLLYPVNGVTIDGSGNVYGTTNIGGSGTSCYEGCGGAFKLTHRGSNWVLTPLYDFMGGSDGGNSDARLIIGPDGDLYGTTSQGGGTGCGGVGCGTVFKLSPPAHACGRALCPWSETVLYRFNGGSDGNSPRGADLVFDRAGTLYGTTFFGGGGGCQDGCGTVYKLTRSGGWTESIVHTFSQSGDGQGPWAGVIFDQSGSLYGTTRSEERRVG